MNRKSPSSREVKMAAMSPARSRLGPLVTEIPTPISPARIRHNDVLPSPGGPASSMWSRGSPRLFVLRLFKRIQRPFRVRRPGNVFGQLVHAGRRDPAAHREVVHLLRAAV